MVVGLVMEGYQEYQNWVLDTYGDVSRTKTITLRKCTRILRVLRGEEAACAENSKFRFWVRNKGFRETAPTGYLYSPADRIQGRNSPQLTLYVPSGNKVCEDRFIKILRLLRMHYRLYRGLQGGFIWSCKLTCESWHEGSHLGSKIVFRRPIIRKSGPPNTDISESCALSWC